jgi:hypothetical protein
MGGVAGLGWRAMIRLIESPVSELECLDQS